MELKIGDAAPAFKSIAVGGIYGAGQPVKLNDFKGSMLILYFYPRDDTPGCTRQACDLRDAWASFGRAGAVVLGVSPDREASRAKFKAKSALPFTLLADPDHSVSELYGVWKEKSFAGKKYM